MIHRLYIHNFRCLENFTLDLAAHPSALLIGRNGSGKTTVVDALAVLQRICRGPNRVREVIAPRDFPWHRKDLPMRFEADFSMGDRRFRYSVSFEWPQGFFEARISEESLSCDGQQIFSREGGQVDLTNGATFGLDWHVFALPVINERPPSTLIQEVRSFFAGMILLSPVPQDITGFSQIPITEMDSRGVEYASCLRSLLQRKPKAYSALESFIRNVLPDFSSIENVERGQEGGSQLVVSFEHPETRRIFTLDFDDLSAGEKCYFLLAYIIAEQSVGQSVVCLWDEPDTHLSLSEVGQFIMSLRKIASRGGQFIATTHHPEAIRRFSDENTFVLSRKSHLDPTVIKPLSAHNHSGDLIDALLREEIVG